MQGKFLGSIRDDSSTTLRVRNPHTGGHGQDDNDRDKAKTST